MKQKKMLINKIGFSINFLNSKKFTSGQHYRNFLAKESFLKSPIYGYW